MFNTAWTDLVLKVGGQILLAVLVILTITFGTDPFFPKENAANMIASRSTQALPITTTITTATTKTNAKTNANAKAANSS